MALPFVGNERPDPDVCAVAAGDADAVAGLPLLPLQHGWETSDRRNAHVALYAAAVRAVAKQLQVPLLDIHSIFSQQGANLQVLLNDGVHFSPEGNQLVAKSLRDLLETHADLAGVRAGALPNHYPLFDQIDAANPERTFSELFQRQLVVPGGQKKAGPTQSTLQ